MSTTNDTNNILSNIQNLQAAQKKLHTELSKLPPNQNFERQKLLITQIDNINAQKIDLFKNLHALQSVMQHDVETSKSDIHGRIQLTNMVEQHLNQAQTRQKQARNENINNLRKTEINNYYSGKYGLYLKIFRYIIYTCVFLVLIALLRQRFFLGAKAANLLAGIVVAIGGYFIVTSAIDLDYRNNLVIDEYDFITEPDEKTGGGHADENTGDGHADENKNQIGIKGKWLSDIERYKKDIELLKKRDCLGEACCKGDGLTFDKKKMICKLDPGKKSKHEGFTGGGLLQPAPIDGGVEPILTPNYGGTYYASP